MSKLSLYQVIAQIVNFKIFDNENVGQWHEQLWEFR